MGGDNGMKVKLEEITIEKDLVVNITNDRKLSEQCGKAARKARSVLAMVKRNFKRLDKQDYKTYKEYCTCTWDIVFRLGLHTLQKISKL